MATRTLNIGVLAFGVLTFALAILGVAARDVGDAWGAAYVSDDPESLPTVESALVLGTSPFGRRGQNFRTLSHRLDAAYALWNAGKASQLIVSGIRIGEDYEEPTVMRNGLVALGVPAEFIRLDFGGTRTWDQVLRARDVYGQKRLLIVSQRDHLARAVFIARHAGIEAWGYPAEGRTYAGLRGQTIGDLSMLRAYFDLVAHAHGRAGGAPAVIGAGPPPWPPGP